MKHLSCNNPRCRQKVHFYKPAFCSRFTHKITTLHTGEQHWEELPVPGYPVRNPDGFAEDDWPLDFYNYQLVKKR